MENMGLYQGAVDKHSLAYGDTEHGRAISTTASGHCNKDQSFPHRVKQITAQFYQPLTRSMAYAVQRYRQIHPMMFNIGIMTLSVINIVCFIAVILKQLYGNKH